MFRVPPQNSPLRPQRKEGRWTFACGSIVLEIAGASLGADLSAVGGKNFKAKVPALRQSNVGGSSGAAPEALASSIAKVYVSKVAESVARAEAEKQVNKLVDKHLGGEAGEAAKGILGNLLGQ